MSRTIVLLLLGALALTNISAQGGPKKLVSLDDDEDLESEVHSASQPIIKAAKLETHSIEFKFEDENSWHPRGSVDVSKDAAGKIISVAVKNEDLQFKINTHQQDIETRCKQGGNKLYQIRIPDYSIYSSIPACHYAKNGLNDTLVFTQDFSGNLNSMAYEVVDTAYLATFEKNPKRKRLMTTKQFETFDTKSVLHGLVEGPRPLFTRYKYDSIGRELKETKTPEQQAADEPQSFLSKYWLYIMIAFLVLPNLLGGGGAAEGAEGAAAGAAAKK